jgi:hypothetical protein
MKTGRLKIVDFDLILANELLWQLDSDAIQSTRYDTFSGLGTITQLLFNLQDKDARKECRWACGAIKGALK